VRVARIAVMDHPPDLRAADAHVLELMVGERFELGHGGEAAAPARITAPPGGHRSGRTPRGHSGSDRNPRDARPQAHDALADCLSAQAPGGVNEPLFHEGALLRREAAEIERGEIEHIVLGHGGLLAPGLRS